MISHPSTGDDVRVTETARTGWIATFRVACDHTGTVLLHPGERKSCVVENFLPD